MKLFLMGILASAMLLAQAPAGEIVGVGNFSHIVQNTRRPYRRAEQKGQNLPSNALNATSR